MHVPNGEQHPAARQQIVHVTADAAGEIESLLQHYGLLGAKCLRIAATAEGPRAELDRQRPGDIVLVHKSQPLLLMDPDSVSAYAGQVLHYNSEECEFCFLIVD
jgi:hypothetical protein